MKILIIAMQHGNEVFGKKVIDHFSNSDIDTLIANPKAYEKNVRFIESDMNRSYKRQNPSTYEERRADEVYKNAVNYDFVIDIHTTTSDIDFVPIIATLNPVTKLALSHLPTLEIARMVFEGSEHSLIGSIDSSISMEFNETYSQNPEALEIIDAMIIGIKSGRIGKYVDKNIYNISGIIPASTVIGSEEKNFIYSERYGYYPFLIGEKHYKKYNGFYAKDFESIKLS